MPRPDSTDPEAPLSAAWHDARLSRREALRQAGFAAAALTVGRYFLDAPAASAASSSTLSTAPLQIAVVRPSSARQAAALLAFDDTHARPEGAVELLLWPGDKARLDELGIDYTVTVEDVVARSRASARSAPAAAPNRPMPGGKRTGYRRLPDYENELDALAKKNKGLVRLVRLAEPSLEGRTIFGVEIGRRAGAQDGRPMSYFDGLHHAREWPAGEYSLIFAHWLVENYGRNPRVTRLLNKSYVTVIPIVNVDGFNYSREFPMEDPGGFSSIVAGGQAAYWRKNRRQQPVADHPPNGEVNPLAYGVDPNRNYPFLWGATTGGALGFADDAPVYATTSPNPFDQTYYGTDALSEPENRGVARYLLSHNVTGLISSHTVGGLILRPWGHTDEDPVDAKLLKALGDRMGSILNYVSQIGLGLYPTTGTTDDWYYAATACLGYTVEHGKADFHPPYTNPGEVADFWPKVMEAFMVLAEAAADPKKHSVVSGRVVDGRGRPVAGARLRIHKEFDTPMWPAGPGGVGPAVARKEATHEVVDLEMKAGPDGRFEWHLNPSTRPLVAKDGKKETYELTVTGAGGKFSKRVYVRRGQRLNLGNVVLR